MPPGASSEWLWEANRQIKELLLLGEGWDDDGGEPISPTAVEHAQWLVARVAEIVDVPRPFVSPTLHGGISVEFDEPVTKLRAIFVMEPSDDAEFPYGRERLIVDWVVKRDEDVVAEGEGERVPVEVLPALSGE